MALTASLVALILYMDRGLDLTDESYYLLCAYSPDRLLMQGSQFGHYTGLLFRMAGSSLPLFRLMGLAVLFFTGLLFAMKVEAFSGQIIRATPRSGALGRISTITLGVLGYYGIWMTTPSYNWLNLLSVLLAVTSLLGSSGAEETTLPGPRQKTQRTAAWGALLGASVALAFMARPYTAITLVVMAAVWGTLSGPRERRKIFFLSAAGSSLLFFLLHVVFFEKNIFSYLEEMKTSLALNRHFLSYEPGFIFSDAMTSLTRFFTRFLEINRYLILILLVTNFALPRLKVPSFVQGLCFTLFCASFWIIVSRRSGMPAFWRSGLVSLSYCMGFLLSRLAFCPNPLANRRLFLPLLLIAASASFAFSSENGLIEEMSMSFGLLATAALIIATNVEDGMLGRIHNALMCLLMTISTLVILHHGFQRPYRLPAPLVSQTLPVKLEGVPGILKVDSVTRNYIDALQKAAKNSGWVPGTSFIDLTETPGAAAILHASPPVTAWLYGERYKGFTEAALAIAGDEKLRGAWILTTPSKKETRTPEVVLKQRGLHFPENYVLAGEFQRPFDGEKQNLWKPRN